MACLVVASIGFARAPIRSPKYTPLGLSEQAFDVLATTPIERLSKRPFPPRRIVPHRCPLKSYIRLHLAEPDLSLSATAAALDLSARYVNASCRTKRPRSSVLRSPSAVCSASTTLSRCASGVRGRGTLRLPFRKSETPLALVESVQSAIMQDCAIRLRA